MNLPGAAIPAETRTLNLISAGWAAQHFTKQAGPVEAIPTPLDGWNRQCRDEGGGIGLAPSWYVLVAGSTGHGKSLLALNMGAHAIKHGISPAFISLEMSSTQLATRLYGIISGRHIRELERGASFNPEAGMDVEYLMGELAGKGLGFYTNSQPIFALADVLKLMAFFHEEQDVRLFFVDYLQLVSSGDETETTREVTKISHMMRHFARTKNVTVVALSQFNRSTSSNRGEKPIVQGLIGSSSLENDADQVLMLDHSRYAADPHTSKAMTWALLGKNRHGALGQVPIEWDYKTLRLREGQLDEEHRWPQSKTKNHERASG